MAKQATQAKPTGKNVTTLKTHGLPADIRRLAEENTGLGVSHRPEDNVVPLIYLLQSNSPQTQKGHEKYIKGAVGGSIWLRNEAVEESIIDGEEGMLFQPVMLQVCWVEWLPNRGGFVARHLHRPEVAELKDVERDDGTVAQAWMMPNGNVVNESREYPGLVHVEGRDLLPYTLLMGGSNLGVAKRWMTFMGKEHVTVDGEDIGKIADLHWNLYRLTTILRTRDKFSWNMYDFVKEGQIIDLFKPDVARKYLMIGKALHEAFTQGIKQSAAMESETASTTEVDN